MKVRLTMGAILITVLSLVFLYELYRNDKNDGERVRVRVIKGGGGEDREEKEKEGEREESIDPGVWTRQTELQLRTFIVSKLRHRDISFCHLSREELARRMINFSRGYQSLSEFLSIAKDESVFNHMLRVACNMNSLD